MAVKTLKKNQTIIDFVCQHTGALDNLFSVLIANDLSITDTITPGNFLNVDVFTNNVVNYYLKTGEDILTFENNAERGGIGFMQIGSNFIVS